MNLTTENALHGIDELLRERIAPEIGDPFAAQMARLSSLLLRICANAVEDAAALRVDENAAIRHLLADVGVLADGPQADRLAQAAESADPGLAVSVLDAENHRLRCLLVDAQEWLESRRDEAAVVLDQRIWRHLEETETRRAPRE